MDHTLEVSNDNFYKEVYRPQFHYSSRTGWLNDPNGLVYYQGEYHLFYQHNPSDVKWGNMHWGHAVSNDLVHWAERDIALYPDEWGTMFSGCAVIDWNNTAGFQTGKEATIVLIYTAADCKTPISQGQPFTQCIAYSQDKGLTWTKYEMNPVLHHIRESNRDPKVIWHEPSQKWVMALFLDDQDYALLSSDDLIHWIKIDDLHLPGISECPDFFPLAVEGDAAQQKWIYWGATRGGYQVGNFDGKTFTPDHDVQFTVAEGGHSYAAQTWSDIPREDGRTLQITWSTFEVPGMPFNCFMTFPTELTLRKTSKGLTLLVNPVKEIEGLYGSRMDWNQIELADHVPEVFDCASELLDIDVQFDVGTAESIELMIHGTLITFDVLQEKLSCLQAEASFQTEDHKISLRILVDRSFIEIYGNGGILYMPVGFLGDTSNRTFTALALGGTATLLTMKVNELKSIW